MDDSPLPAVPTRPYVCGNSIVDNVSGFMENTLLRFLPWRSVEMDAGCYPAGTIRLSGSKRSRGNLKRESLRIGIRVRVHSLKFFSPLTFLTVEGYARTAISPRKRSSTL
jgi:hypothetical protein